MSQHLDDTLNGMYTAHPSSAVRASGHCQRAPPPFISLLLLLLLERGFPHQRPYSSRLDVFLALAMICFDGVAESWLQLLWSDLQRSCAVESAHWDDSSFCFVTLKLSDRLRNTFFCHFAFSHTLSQGFQLFSGNIEFFSAIG